MNAHDPEMKPAVLSASRVFLTGWGQFDTHTAVLEDGRHNRHPDAGKPYRGISSEQIVAMVHDPQRVPKEEAQWFIPSDYLGADGRSHEAQRERGRFHWLALDVDGNNLALCDMLDALKATVPGARLLIYASRSATADNRKWRALVPLKVPVPGADYQATQEAFFDLLEEASQGVLIPDRALARPGQLVYLPNRGDFYDRHYERGEGLLLPTPEHPIMQRRETVAAAEQEAEAERQQRTERRRERALGETSPVDHFNAAHDVVELLTRYGYQRRPGKGARDWRSPYQTTTGGYATRCFGDCWVSLSGSDADAGIGAATKSGARHGDAFDLYCHYEHRGDFNAALRAYSREAGLDRLHYGAIENGGTAAATDGQLRSNDDECAFDLSHDALALDMGQRAGWNYNARHVGEWGTWLFWDGARWRKDNCREDMTRTRAYLRDRAKGLLAWAEEQAPRSEAEKRGEGDKLLAWADREARILRNKATVSAVESLAQSNPDLVAASGDFDQDKLLLGTPGGTVDLRTGELRPARREDRITKLTAVTPASGRPTLWLQFLDHVFGGDTEVIEFMQRVAGYALTGETREHKLLFLYGTGRNGKSVFLNTLFYVFGDYARRAHASAFLNSNGERHPTDIAGLQGARFVAASELPKGRTWDEATIKDLTGGDVLTARFMRGDFFDFEPQLTLMIAGNNMPSFRGVDEAIRARVVLVPFTVTIPPEKRDPALPEKLKAEAGQILSWAIEGAVAWQRHGLAVPDSIAAASTEYFDDEDVLGQFIADEVVREPQGFVTTTELHHCFAEWAFSQGLNAWTLRTLQKEMKARGFQDGRRDYGRGFRGVRLKR